MPASVAEQLDPSVLEPIFADIEPVRKDINIIRCLVAPIGEERYIRLRQVTPIDRVELHSRTAVPAQDRNMYFVDGMQPRGKERYLHFITAIWQRSPDGSMLYENGGSMRHFKPGELEELGKSALELFQQYDEHNVGHYVNQSRLQGWFNPDIHTSEGMVELAAILGAEVNETG